MVNPRLLLLVPALLGLFLAPVIIPAVLVEDPAEDHAPAPAAVSEVAGCAMFCAETRGCSAFCDEPEPGCSMFCDTPEVVAVCAIFCNNPEEVR
ncbi:hypothetical protein [Nocardia asteroides]|uniref:hypothetical protein n=1 Tax=Nocardia asteroides TaxID=1824 RepID=UPI001E2CFDB2|nr:hypothetical protein [Nocardia asteroides]UGT53770.1 hypothetical protein LTT85_24275 [Nocardia asteroides]